MPGNPLITNYLNDTSIPVDIRRNISNGLNSGDLSEDDAIKGISSKYGSKYGSYTSSNLQQSDTNNNPAPPQTSTPSSSWTPQQIQQYEDQKTQRNPVYQAGNWLYNNVVKTPASFVAGAPVTLYKNAQALGKAVSDLPAAIAQGGLSNIDKPLNLPHSLQEIDQTATAPVDIPGLGNVNMLAADQNGKFDLGQTFRNEIGKGAQTLATIGSFGSPIGGLAADATPEAIAAAKIAASKLAVPWAAGIGATGAAGQTLQNPNAGAADIISSAAIGGLSGAALQGVLGKLFPTATAASEMTENQLSKAASKVGIAKETLQAMTPEEKALQAQYVTQASMNAANKYAATAPIDSLADETTTGMQKLQALRKQTGAAISAAKTAIKNGPPIPLDADVINSLKSDFAQQLESPNIEATLQTPTKKNPFGNIDFTDSVLSSKGDRDLLSAAWQKLNKSENLYDLIKMKSTLEDKLKFGKIQGTAGSSESVLKNLLYGGDEEEGEGGVRAIIHSLSPELQEADPIYKELSDNIGDFQRKTNSKLASLAKPEDNAINGANTFSLLRKASGGGLRENGKFIQVIQDMGDKYGIPELQNLTKKVDMAQRAEDIASTDVLNRPTSLAGRVVKGAKIGSKIASGRILEAGKDALDLATEAPQTSSHFLKLLQQAKRPEDLGLGKSAQGLLKLLLPSSFGAGTSSILSPLIGSQAQQAISGLGGEATGGAMFNPPLPPPTRFSS